ncbi:Cytochrome P450 87A3 [Dichanthelium oligosanthes]|uniref:Cytochrome P450 87A3 n=1 Tax=Dichanthelium oligosanthes TaxID=888268 RepID=A0A1E5UMM4_9POAL|nr:Cytochrome P450 87A3 [Dichanthelium oligosanthes]
MNPSCNGILPPGSMGLPILGESFQFFKMSYSLDIPDFYKLRLKRLFGLEYLKYSLLAELEGAIRDNFAECSAKDAIDVNDSTPDMIIDLVENLVSLNPAESRELTKNYSAFLQGLISFPLYVPRTTFYKCMQGRRNMQKIVSELLRKRLTDTKHGDFLDLIVEELQSETPTVDEKFTTDALVALLFTSFVTLAPIL